MIRIISEMPEIYDDKTGNTGKAFRIGYRSRAIVNSVTVKRRKEWICADCSGQG
jgi:hypothetical protein